MIPIKLLYAFVCDDVRQEINGKMTYVGQTEGYTVPQVPVVFSKLCMVYSAMGLKGKFQVEVAIRERSSGQQLLHIPKHEVDFQNEEHKIREVVQMNGLKLERDGHYEVGIFYNDELVHVFYFTLNIAVPDPIKGKPDLGINLPIIMSSMN